MSIGGDPAIFCCQNGFILNFESKIMKYYESPVLIAKDYNCYSENISEQLSILHFWTFTNNHLDKLKAQQPTFINSSIYASQRYNKYRRPSACIRNIIYPQALLAHRTNWYESRNTSKKIDYPRNEMSVYTGTNWLNIMWRVSLWKHITNIKISEDTWISYA